jgi:hypothetical protein
MDPSFRWDDVGYLANRPLPGLDGHLNGPWYSPIPHSSISRGFPPIPLAMAQV